MSLALIRDVWELRLARTLSRLLLGTTMLAALSTTSLANPYDSSKSGYQCLQQAKDLEVIWQADWHPTSTSSLEDHGLAYKVREVKEKKNLVGVASRTTTLTLEAVSTKAQQKTRVMKITREEQARSVCLKLQAASQPKAGDLDPPIADISARPPAARKGEQFAKLPYITHESKNGWVRADVPADGELSRCDVGTKQFSCLLRYKQEFSVELLELEQEIKFHRE